MRVVVVTPPDPVVDLERVKQHLEVEHDDRDDLIAGMIAAATAHIDGPDGWLGRAIGVQTLETGFWSFDPCGMRLPFPPVTEIVSVTYRDESGAEQTVPTDDIELFDDLIFPGWMKAWPNARPMRASVRVRYRAGYSTVPDPIIAAILLMVGDLWRNRDTVAALGAAKIPMSTTVENLLAPFRVYR